MTSIVQLYSIYLQHPVVCTDTRDIRRSAVFFALKGPNFNANEFADQALEKGCAYAVVDEEKYQTSDRHILVPDALEALQQLANYHRKQLNIPVIAITGSNGKTTSKELVSAVLSRKYKTLATQGNLNNHIGVPLTLLSIERSHQVAVVEMGANHQKEIEGLCKIAEPNCVAITNIGKAHLEGFGGYDGVIKAKSEMYDFARKNDGVAFVNGDNELLMKLSAGIERIVFGSSGSQNTGMDFYGKFLEADPFVKLKWKKVTDAEGIDTKPVVSSQLIGKYNFENILFAISAGAYFGVTEEGIREAIENYAPSNNRSQVMKKGSNTILLDAYNANPTSMKAAIENFSEMKADNKVLVLGDMLELGEESLREHQQIIALIHQKNFSNAILVGSWFSKAVHSFGEDKINARTFQHVDEAIQWLAKNKLSNVTALIKGSRGIKLEKVVLTAIGWV